MRAKNEGVGNYLTRIIEHGILVDTGALMCSIPAPGSTSDGKNPEAMKSAVERGRSVLPIRPHDLLEAALAACMNMWIRMNAQAIGLQTDSIETEVLLNRSDPERTVFEYTARVTTKENTSAELAEKVKELLQTCPVRKTLSKEIAFVERNIELLKVTR